MLLGEFEHSLDDKGRLFIPARLRDALGKHFYLCKGFDGCLMVYDEASWQRFTEKLNNLSMGLKKNRDLKRFFFSGASDVSCDKQGRVVGDKAEIWAAAKWQEKDRMADQEMAEEMEDLDLDI